MKFMHSAGVMHRDIKPDNILINKKGNFMICDFGLSRGTITDDEETKSALTRNLDVMIQPERKCNRSASNSDS